MRGTAVVTGASAGLGRIYADRLARRGYDLLLVARRADRLAELATELEAQYPIRAEVLVADLGEARDLDRVATRLGEDEAITCLVNNAGTSTLGPLSGSKASDESAMINVNVTALTRLTVAVLERFRRLSSGTIVNVGSVLGFHSLPISAIYSGTKGYVTNFTRGLQEELAGTGIVVQLVAPAATATDIWDISGVPLSNLDPDTVMTAGDCVDASMAGLALGESVTLTSVEDIQLFSDYETARLKLLSASQTSRPASRYNLSKQGTA
ncbi:SDR family NAD(P)-dependent oxidoreductase [Granulicella sibirica]|uniref:SDR family NAD(P)-dependent oxidoreductase n=1 Tax=Granulicella sibirica TaxID=2479048 RepID=UPI0019D53CE4|nr:SDR family oxidoreductase [Granulicella sibirica]